LRFAWSDIDILRHRTIGHSLEESHLCRAGDRWWRESVVVRPVGFRHGHGYGRSIVESQMIVRKLRLDRGWSQEQLAEFAGVSVRTIQRMERGRRVGLETLKCVAAVFETDLKSLQPETKMNPQQHVHMSQRERDAMEYVRDLKSFYAHLASFVVVMPILYLVDVYYYSDAGVSLDAGSHPGVDWFIWTALGWGCGVAFHGLVVYELFGFLGVDWERRQIEKRLKR
jgi:transcriptional regulator with XRE-family HTH domain